MNIAVDEVVRRLRAKGQPIRLFGETDEERKIRLRALEVIEERTEVSDEPDLFVLIIQRYIQLPLIYAIGSTK